MLNVVLNILEMRTEALDQAIKYRYDPHLSKAHQFYLDKIDGLLITLEKAIDAVSFSIKEKKLSEKRYTEQLLLESIKRELEESVGV